MTAQPDNMPSAPIDLEEYAREAKRPPPGQRYRVRIDREHHIFDQADPTGREILAVVGKTPEEYVLSQRIHGQGAKRIEADEKVDLTAPGVERFVTMRRERNDG